MAAKAARYSQGTRVLPFTHSVGDGYGYSKLSINFPEIMALAALVIHVPGVLGAIETIGAVISIFD